MTRSKRKEEDYDTRNHDDLLEQGFIGRIYRYGKYLLQIDFTLNVDCRNILASFKQVFLMCINVRCPLYCSY